MRLNRAIVAVFGWFNGDRRIEIVQIVNYPPSPETSKFFLQYDTENGWILGVGKSDEEIPLSVLNLLPSGVASYPIDNHPLRENIFEKPSDYIVDLRTNEIREQTSEEKEAFTIWQEQQV